MVVVAVVVVVVVAVVVVVVVAVVVVVVFQDMSLVHLFLFSETWLNITNGTQFYY